METAFIGYQHETSQEYKLRTSNSIKVRNRSRIQQAAKRRTQPTLWDESLGYYTKSWNCTHARRFQSRSDGLRTNHTVRRIDCQAKLNALLFEDTDRAFCVRVKTHDSTHNHKIDQNVFNTYAETRKNTSPATRSVVRTMWQVGAKRMKILRYLKDVSGKPILSQDVNNLMTEMRRQSYTSPDDNIRATELLPDFSEGPGNVVNVFRGVSTRLTSCITFQTCHMRRMARLFPEVMCVDATHGTNINRYRLFSFMVTDKYGNGAFAQHALIDRESRQNMKSAISAFKRNNKTWSDVKVIVIDMDFTGLSTLEAEFPEATVLLCHFHVIDYLKREISKRDYGFSNFEKLHLKTIITMMVRAPSETSFNHYLDALKELCRAKPGFVDYLSSNWLPCKEYWCTFLRGNIPHLDNNTNNRLEASWGAAKDVLTRHMPVDECIETLLFLQQASEDKYRIKATKVGYRVNNRYDQDMVRLARIATHHACTLVEEQCKASRHAVYNVEASGMVATFQTLESNESKQKYAVNIDTNTCSCVFNRTQLLPCRHIIFLRRKLSRSPTIPDDAIPPRWALLDDPETSILNDELSSSFSIADVGDTRLKAMSHNFKYKSAFSVWQRITDVVADKGTCDFNRWLGQLKQLERIARINVNPTQSPGTSTSSPDLMSESKDDLEEKMVGLVGGKKCSGNSRDVSGKSSVETEEVSGKSSVESNGFGIAKQRLNWDSVDDKKMNDESIFPDKGRGPSTENDKSTVLTKQPVPLIDLNKASRPSGRPKLQQAFKKAKRQTEFQDSKDLANRLTTIEDVTLENFRQVVQQKRLSLCDIRNVFDGLRLMHSDGVFKRPKAKLVDSSEGNTGEANVRGILPAALINKCITAIQILIVREKASSGSAPPQENIVVVILNVGTFRAGDIEIMNEWHSVSNLVRGAKSLISWTKGMSLDDPMDKNEQDRIVDSIMTLDMRGSINSSGETVDFADLVRLGDEGWLSDQCLVSATTRIAAEASRNSPPTIHVVNPTFAYFEADDQRCSLLDTKEFIFSKCHDGLTMLCPIYINMDFGHWCGVTIDIKRRIIWIYDPFHKKKHEDEVEKKIKAVFLPLIDPAYMLEIRMYRAWLQLDGFNCGVLVTHWFDHYVSTYLLSPDKEVCTDTDSLSRSALVKIRYKLFRYVLYGMNVSLVE